MVPNGDLNGRTDRRGMRVSCRFTLTPHGEYRVGTGPHARQSWGADAPVSRPGPSPRPRTRQGYRIHTVELLSLPRRLLSAGAGQVNEGRGSNKRERRQPNVKLVVSGCLSGVVGGLCQWQSQPEMGRALCRSVWPAPPWFLNSSLVKTRGNGSAGVLVPGRHGPGIRGSFLSVTVGIANLNE